MLTPWVRNLLIANVAVFFLQATLPLITNLFAFVPSLALVRPWTIVTYMFLHGGFMHLLFNMLGLFFFGPRLEERLGPKQFATLYFASGIAGALVSMLLSRAPIIGASAGVFGVMLGFAYYWPHVQILIWGIIPVPARVLVIVTTVLALWNGLSGGGGGIAHFAHLGGYAGAFLYLKWIERSKDQFKKKAIGATSKTPLPFRSGTKRPAIDIKTVHEVNRDEVNRILDKITASGMDSLTPQERVFLSNFVPPEGKVPPVS